MIFPTWREWLKDSSRKQFIDSAFYKEWQKVLENEAWNDLPDGWAVIFHLHPELQKYTEDFHSKQVSVDTDSDVGALIRDSSAVLTDYSSVYFDFLYRNLPVTFFQFDFDRFQKEHYGLAAPYEDFGNISHTPEQAVASLISSLNDSGKMRGVTAQIFFHQDDHNCERTYEAICAKVKAL